jgi:hypothetical protein
MSEVIKVAKEPGAAQAVPGKAGQSPQDSPTTEVIKFGKAPGAAPAVSTKPDQLPQEVTAIAAVFSNSLKALDAVAAEQAKWLVDLAICLAEAARSSSLATSRTGSDAGDSRMDTLVTGLKQSAETQLKAFTKAQARLADIAAAALQSDPHSGSGSVSPANTSTPVGAALANMVSNLNLAQQNAVANQQAMNTLAQAATAAGVNLLYSVTGAAADAASSGESG